MARTMSPKTGTEEKRTRGVVVSREVFGRKGREGSHTLVLKLKLDSQPSVPFPITVE